MSRFLIAANTLAGRCDRTPSQPLLWRQLLSVSGLFLGISCTFWLTSSKANALEEVRLAYEGFQFGSLAVEDLNTFSTTGQPSPNLEALLRAIQVDQATALSVLNTEVAVDGSLLNEASRTFIGESFFQLVGTTITLPGSAEPSWTYLRDALILAAADNQITALEVLQEFPTDAVVLETDKVGPVIEKIKKDTSAVEAFFDAGFLNTP